MKCDAFHLSAFHFVSEFQKDVVCCIALLHYRLQHTVARCNTLQHPLQHSAALCHIQHIAVLHCSK